ncbi:GAF domain-containing sensor histidine kinase [Dokdonia sinensis]|uniref:histidine kinase n=1 Tax=Dokdonia sinensis TaxID=2479847 RepID=A0A3M0GQI9_9FLAO|nr:GAF domain-containing sensor histidine kinase [Dokdonia sinensis]RMB59546.1 GAF domain-containing sensor histidine kinase [Dokdonia sinensis]
MKRAPIPVHEDKRLEAVYSYKLLDTLPEKSYDAITSLASVLCDTPISLVTVMDAERNFLKSHLGVPFNESPRDISFCGHAIVEPEPIFIVEDARVDPRFADNPLVAEHNAIFYAGVPLRTNDGYALGTLCIYDTKPRKLTEVQKDGLHNLAHQTMELFEARLRNLQLEEVTEELQERNHQLQAFSNLIAHDLKSPVNSIVGLIRLIREDFEDTLTDDLNEYLHMIEKSSYSLSNYVENLHAHYKSKDLLNKPKVDVDFIVMIEDIKSLLLIKNEEIIVPTSIRLKGINESAVKQILVNLITNALKYNDKEQPEIRLKAQSSDSHYIFEISDNGMGISKESQERVFEMFKTAGVKDKSGNQGSGIGLATVKELVTKLGGTITLKSELEKGSTFTFTILK